MLKFIKQALITLLSFIKLIISLSREAKVSDPAKCISLNNEQCMARPTAINESKTVIKVIKHISCNCKCKVDGRKCSLNQKLNKNKCQCECRNPIKIVYTEKIIFGIVVHVLERMINI